MKRCEEIEMSGVKFLNLSDLDNRFDIPLQAAHQFINNDQLLYAPITIGHPFVTTPASHNSFFSQTENQVRAYFDGIHPAKICDYIPPKLVDQLRIVGYVTGARIDSSRRLIVDAMLNESLIPSNELNCDTSQQPISFQASLHHVAMQPYEVQKENNNLQCLNHLIPAEVALVVRGDTARRPGSELVKCVSFFD